MSYFDNIYKKRINRFGENYTERLENGRRLNFDRFLNQSPHATTFSYLNNEQEEVVIECVFEPLRDDQTRNLMHLLCAADIKIMPGVVGTIEGQRYMVWYHNERSYSGYNRYVLIRMNVEVKWVEDDLEHTSDAYLYYQQDNILKQELKSRSRMDTLYLENLKLNFLTLPATPYIKLNTYIEIPAVTGEIQAFRVTGYDIVSTPHVMYVSMDPSYQRNLTPLAPSADDDAEDYFWLTGE